MMNPMFVILNMSPLCHSQPRTWYPGNEVAVESAAGCTNFLVVESAGCMNNQLRRVSFYRIATLLQGKGGRKKGRFQGKASTLKTRNDAEEFLKEFTTLSINGTA